MAKDPAFLFYTNDFDSKTKFFTHHQVGLYMRLLMAQHQHGHLSKQQMNFIAGGEPDEVVFSKFTEDTDGLFFNQRLEDEILKRKKFSESRRKNRLGSTSKKDKKKKSKNTSGNTSKSYVNHMENEDVNDNEDVNKGGIRGEHSKVDVVLPFDSGKFKKAWHEWKQNLIDQGKFYKGFHSEQADLKILAEFANGSETIAINVIYNAIAKQWKNLNVELFKPTNGTSKPKNRNR